MMTREQIERIAADCGVEVSYTEAGKGGFIIDSSNKIHESLKDLFAGVFEISNDNYKVYVIGDETVLFAA